MEEAVRTCLDKAGGPVNIVRYSISDTGCDARHTRSSALVTRSSVSTTRTSITTTVRPRRKVQEEEFRSNGHGGVGERERERESETRTNAGPPDRTGQDRTYCWVSLTILCPSWESSHLISSHSRVLSVGET